jgi:group I intron endonuclease
MYKLYKIVNKINNHAYIGMTKQSLEKRFSQHKNCANNLKKKTIFYDAMRSYGVNNFEIFLISTFIDKTSCEKAEIQSIKEIGYYNMAKGGNGGFVVKDVDKWKLKLSKSRKNKKPALGMRHTQENKKLFSEVSKKYWETQSTYNWEEFKDLTHKEAKEKFGISTTHYYRLKNGLGVTPLSE